VNYATSFAASPDAVTADIEFLANGPGRPFSYGYDPDADAPPPSTEFTAHRVLIRDVRGTRPLSLAANGAILLQSPTAVRNFYDDDELLGRYYPEAAEVIRDALGASRAVIFDHNVRRGGRLALRADRYDQGRPVHHAHTDYTEVSAARRLRDEFGAAANELAGCRYVQVNLWRPIRAPLRDAPLAICDGATVTPQSLRPADLRYPNRCGELYYLAHEAGQRWYYASDMGTDEAWLFKNFDSTPTGTGWVAPHSAFEDPRRHPHVPPRESIEVRAFAIFDA
jgi:hypothetical protein